MLFTMALKKHSYIVWNISKINVIVSLKKWSTNIEILSNGLTNLL